jgi:hypothetical protein
MNLKIHSTITLSILTFALIAAGIPSAFDNVYAQGEGEDTGGTTGSEGGLTEGGGNTTDGTSEGDTGTTDGTSEDES